MAIYTETFLFTPLPAGKDGTKLRIAVLVSPRLSSDDLASAEADLNNWPDARDWPSISPTWKVQVQHGGKTVVFDATEIKDAAYDFATWQQMFPGTSKVIPYQPDDKSKAPIFSYPVKKVIDTAKDLHAKVLKGHRTEFPSLEALEAFDSFQELKQAANQGFTDEVVCTQLGGPVSDSERGIADAFGLASGFHGSRACSESSSPVPHIDSISPTSGESDGAETVTIFGSNFGFGSIPLFDGLEATNISISVGEDEISCKTPAHTTGKVNVFVRLGDLISNGVTFTYTPDTDPK